MSGEQGLAALLGVLSLWIPAAWSGEGSEKGMEPAEQPRLRLSVVFNNIPQKAGLTTSWGFSCLVEGLSRTILFDTGGSGRILVSNMEKLDLEVREVDAVVLSHIHGDHTGGLKEILAQNPDVTVFAPASFPASFLQEVRRLGATTVTVSGPQKLFDRVYSTGVLNGGIPEQALILDSPEGLIIITGCAHPGIADMAERARSYLGKDILLLLGGFHLGQAGRTEIHSVIERLKNLKVKKVAPSHCTGDTAIRMFRESWGTDFVEGGLGASIDLPW